MRANDASEAEAENGEAEARLQVHPVHGAPIEVNGIRLVDSEPATASGSLGRQCAHTGP